MLKVHGPCRLNGMKFQHMWRKEWTNHSFVN